MLCIVNDFLFKEVFMNLKISTKLLQDMVGKSIQCVSNNKLIPITSLMNIKVNSNKLTITTTDATNYFYVTSEEKFDCENIEFSILADTFAKLIQKTTSDTVTLSVNDNIFEVKGNGTYKIEMPLDENGQVIKFPVKLPDIEPPIDGEIKLSTVNSILNYNKPSLAISMEVPALTNYYCGNNVVTSDQKKICAYDIKTFGDRELLITPKFMELLGVMSEETINVHISDDEIICWDKTDTIYAPITEGVEKFPVTAINSLVQSDFKANCKLSRAVVTEVLDRLSLFVSPYDEKAIILTFTKDGLLFSSKKSSGTELVPYITSENFIEFRCLIDIDMLKSQIAAQNSDNIDMYYGLPMAIKMVSDKVTQIVALMMEN